MMKKLLLVSILFVSAFAFTQEKQSFKTTLKERVIEHRKSFIKSAKKADSIFYKSKESVKFMKAYDKDRKMTEKYIKLLLNKN